MASKLKYRVQDSAVCNLSERNQTEQRQEILSCAVTGNLFNRFQILLTAIFQENVDEKEMALGLKVDKKEDKYQKALRNFLAFMIRSITHSNKWTNQIWPYEYGTNF